MQLTKNFKLIEFLSSDFYDDNSQLRVYEDALSNDSITDNLQELAENLQVLRDHLGTEINVNIAFRPQWWELKKGRSGNSKHCLGQAADITAKGKKPSEVHAAIELLISKGKMKQGGLGKYNTFTHYDIRGTKARWNG